MIEVKPTLVIPPSEDEILLNSWLGAFPSNKWIDTQNRRWFWVIFNAKSMPPAYEYKIKFDIFTNNFTIVFPFVVKTSDSKVNKVFIDGIEYQARGRENYGDRFIVSGLEFSFKVATKLKLGEGVHPILTYNFHHGTFISINSFVSDYIRRRYYLSTFQIVHPIQMDYRAIRIPYNVNLNYWDWDKFDGVWITHETWMPVGYIINSWDKFLDGVWITHETWVSPVLVILKTINSLSCNYHTTRNIFGGFINVNTVSARIVNYGDTSWDRFGGMWRTCETWMP